MSAKGCVKIKVEEDYDQVMIEEHLSCEDDNSDVTGNTSSASLNNYESQPTDTGKQPISSPTQTHKRWNPERQRGNRSSQSTRGSVSLTCSMGMEQGESSLHVTQEYDGQQLYGEDRSLSKDSLGTDQLRTLGEILAYCQVMYGAIQKLDEKFEQLQAKVTNIHVIQLTPEVFPLQKVTSKTPSAPTDRHPSGVDTSSVSDPALSMPQLVRVCSPPPPTSVEVKRPPALSPVPRLPSPPSLAPQGANDSLVKSVSAHLSNHLIPLNRAVEKQIPSQGPNDSLVKSVVAAHLSNHLIPLNKAIEKQIPSHSHTVPGASPKTVWLGSNKRNVCISQSALQKANQMSTPGRAVRFLMRCVFSIEEMSCSNTLGDATRGLKKLDPNKLSAIREWLAGRYPEYDLKEKGKDWRKCMSVMNSTARYLRLMAKRRRLKMQKEGEETSKPPDVTDTHIEPIPETEADQDPEAELPGDNYVAEIEDPVELENYTRITEIGEPIEEYTAEIDVELSESEEEDEASLKTQTEKEEESSPTSCSDVAYEYLGNPERNVKVPQYAMFTALQRKRPELAARVLIKYMFPEEVLVVSNVHGNNESGIQALDYNKISALREHLQERFPWLLLEEDGQDWKVCVGAINSTIRKFRHDLKMGRGRKKGT